VAEPLIEKAAAILRAGGLVAFPTETVYGLGADATSADAVARIFAAKGRPPTNPVIVHVVDAGVAQRYVTHWPDTAQQLASRFWPGPLTLVLPKASNIPPIVTAGRDTVGLRAPAHSVALALLRAFDGPIAAPSANQSNHLSPTTAQHVRDEFGSSVDLILDGGSCQVGIESTVLDLSLPIPRILRPGSVTREQIESVVGPVEMNSNITSVALPASSPGQHPVHYAPRTKSFRFLPSERDRVPASSGIIGFTETAKVRMPSDPALYAQRMYQVLRELDAMGLPAIYVEMPPDEPKWTAVRDRLIRATTPMPS
jgi:L-threonylcarbamoyladenylate synthase